MAEQDFERRELTFEQAEGIHPLPTQLAKGEVSKILAARLWQALYDDMKRYASPYGGDLLLSEPWRAALTDFYVRKHGLFADEVKRTLQANAKVLKGIFQSGDYAAILGTVEWLVRRQQGKYLPGQIKKILEEERSAYRLIDGQDIVLLASEEEGKALVRALDVLGSEGFEGARKHLKEAASALALGRYADSVRESIHSIESASRTISPSSKFSDALAQIEASGRLHAAFKRGLLALYGYTSDEQGIRHPLLANGDAAVKEEDALLMLGICSAAVTYLVSKT